MHSMGDNTLAPDTVDCGTQYSDNGEDIMEDEVVKTRYQVTSEMEVKLSVLSNKLLHGSYWFLLLDVMLTSKWDMAAQARAARMREAVCREAAVNIMTWIKEMGGCLR